MLFTTLILALCLAGTALRADTESTSALYLLGGVDGKLLTNTDADNYFGVPADLLGPKGYDSPVVHLGLQIERWMAVELSGNFGPDRYNQVSYSSDGGLETRQVTTQWNLDTYSITPALTWAGPGFVNFLGL
ncbi:MAG TPA: hypothetical protein VK786_04865, partial [bacterium]|nr:hypothetical protein [bacterium]